MKEINENAILTNFILAIGYFFIFFPQLPNSFFSFTGYILSIFHSITGIMLINDEEKLVKKEPMKVIYFDKIQEKSE